MRWRAALEGDMRELDVHVGMSKHNTGKSRTEKKNGRINRPKRDTTETQSTL